MKYYGSLFYISACWLIVAISACTTAPAGQVLKTALPVEVLATGQQCLPAPETWTATWISSLDQLRQVISRCRANRIGTTPKDVPSVDFERFGVLTVEMGQQGSAGYGFDTENVTAYMKDQTAIVKLEWFQPSPEALTAQIITGPWILIRLPAGPYQYIQVVDQNGRFLTQIDI